MNPEVRKQAANALPGKIGMNAETQRRREEKEFDLFFCVFARLCVPSSLHLKK
jgi:hypothetical protein